MSGSTHGIDREVQLTPADDEFARDLGGTTSNDPGGGHADESRQPTHHEALPGPLAALTKEERGRLLILETGAQLEQGGTYVDLDALEDGPFTAFGGQTAETGHRYVAKRDTDHELWNRLVGAEHPVSDASDSEAATGATAEPARSDGDAPRAGRKRGRGRRRAQGTAAESEGGAAPAARRSSVPGVVVGAVRAGAGSIGGGAARVAGGAREVVQKPLVRVAGGARRVVRKPLVAVPIVGVAVASAAAVAATAVIRSRKRDG